MAGAPVTPEEAVLRAERLINKANGETTEEARRTTAALAVKCVVDNKLRIVTEEGAEHLKIWAEGENRRRYFEGKSPLHLPISSPWAETLGRIARGAAETLADRLVRGIAGGGRKSRRRR